METRQTENGFEIVNYGDLVGEVTYLEEGEDYVLNHTYVNPDYRGQGYAEKLVDEVVKLARNKNKKIVPTCSYAIKYFEKRTDCSDVLK